MARRADVLALEALAVGGGLEGELGRSADVTPRASARYRLALTGISRLIRAHPVKIRATPTLTVTG